MIEVHNAIAGSAEERQSAGLETRAIHIATRDLSRAVAFYERVFGLRAIGGDHMAPAILPVNGRADLIIHDLRRSALEPEDFVRAFGFFVTDLDRAREQVWELGVEVARDSGEPDQIYRWPNGRSLYIKAPDGNEIELLELWSGALQRFPKRKAEPAREPKLAVAA